MPPTSDSIPGGARLVVLGSAGLADGFSLIGAEVHADADPSTVETVLEQLARSGDAALVLLESTLAHTGGPWLNRLRNEGGRIVITELPPLPSPRITHRRWTRWYGQSWGRMR